MRNKRFTIANKVMMIAGSVIIILNLVIAAVVSNISLYNAFSHFKASGIEVLNVIARNLDRTKVENVFKSMEEDSGSYREIQQYLMEMKENTSLKYIYTLVYTQGGERAYYLVDGIEETSDEFCQLGEEDELTEDTGDFKKFIQGEAVTSELYSTDEWGELMTVEIPIYNEEDKNVIVLAGDFSAQTIIDENRAFEKRFYLALAVAALVELLGIYICINKIIKSNFQTLSDIIEQTAQFDFKDMDLGKKLVRRKDEVGDISVKVIGMREKLKDKAVLTECMTDQIFSDIEDVHLKLEQAAAASQQINSSISDLVRGINHQALEAGESSDKLQALGENIERLNHEIKQIAGLAQHSKEISDLSRAAIISLKETSQNSSVVSQQVNEKMNLLMTSSKSIQGIMNVISDVAEQTNLLALNAAIEAARAGEAGKGFTIVADEIKKLSTGTASSTEEVGGILEQIQNDVEEVSQAIKLLISDSSSIEGIAEEIIEDSDKIQREFNQIVDGTEVLEKLIMNVDRYKKRVENAIGSIAGEAQQHSAFTEEIAACVEDEVQVTGSLLKTAEELKNSARQLRHTIEEYKF